MCSETTGIVRNQYITKSIVTKNITHVNGVIYFIRFDNFTFYVSGQCMRPQQLNIFYSQKRNDQCLLETSHVLAEAIEHEHLELVWLG